MEETKNGVPGSAAPHCCLLALVEVPEGNMPKNDCNTVVTYCSPFLSLSYYFRIEILNSFSTGVQ